MGKEKKKKDWLDVPLLRSRIRSANVKLFPEATIGYFFGPFLALLSNAIISGYLNRYYTDVMGLTKWAGTFAVLMPVLSVAAVILGNLLVGRLMDRIHTSQGKARPLLLLSAPLIAIALAFLFTAPLNPDGSGASYVTLAWIAISYNLYYSFAYPFYYESHSAFVSLSTRNPNHRSLLAVCSNAAGIAAVGFGCNVVFPLFQGMLFKTDEATHSVLAQASYDAWRVFMIALIAVTFIGILVEYFFTRERVTEEKSVAEAAEEKISLGRQCKACFSDRYWIFIIVFFFLFQLSGLLKNVSMVYYCRWMFVSPSDPNPETTAGAYQAILAAVGGIPTALGMVIAWPLANRFGKARSIAAGLIISALGGLVSIIDPQNFYLVTAGVVLKGIGSISAMYVSLALLSDVLDHLEAKYGFRSDGFTMSVYGSIMVGLTGLAIGILNGLLSASGYDAQSASQNAATKTVLTWCYLGGELVAYSLCAIMFLFMNVERFSALDHAAILEDQKARATAAGLPWTPPEVRLRLEQEEAEKEAEEARLAELKARCEKRGLDFAAEEAKHEKAFAQKAQAAAAKKAAADAKKAAKEKKRAEKIALKEEKRKERLRKRCEAAGLDFAEEERKYQEALSEAKAQKEKKIRAAEEKTARDFADMRRKAQGR